ncbi:MAG: hypothetical protein ACRDBG_26705 [Waterburya sp.]
MSIVDRNTRLATPRQGTITLRVRYVYGSYASAIAHAQLKS